MQRILVHRRDFPVENSVSRESDGGERALESFEKTNFIQTFLKLYSSLEN